MKEFTKYLQGCAPYFAKFVDRNIYVNCFFGEHN